MTDDPSQLLAEEDVEYALAVGGIAWTAVEWGTPLTSAVAGMGAQWLHGAVASGAVADSAGLMAVFAAFYKSEAARVGDASHATQLLEDLRDMAALAETFLADQLERAAFADDPEAGEALLRAGRRRDELIEELGRRPGWGPLD